MASIDAFAKRFYPAIVCGLLGTVAYLQARGISSLIAEQLPAQAVAAPLPGPKQPLALSDAARGKSADVVLSRNAFDSVTGPLGGATVKAPAADPVAFAPATDSGLPPECSSGSVVLIADSDDPAFSFALVKMSGGGGGAGASGVMGGAGRGVSSGGGATMRRVGDDVDGKKVEAIRWDHVVLASESDRCRLVVHDTKRSASSPVESEPTGPSAPLAATPPAGQTQHEDIVKISDTEYSFERNGPDKMNALGQAFLKSGRVVPGKGIRLQRAAQTGILGQVGLVKGDMIKSVNGFDVTEPDQAMLSYAKLKTATRVQVVIERDGKTITMDYSSK